MANEVNWPVEAEALLMKPGAIGVIPTDTVYCVVARAQDKEAVARLYRLKRREHKPGTLIAANIDQLVELGIKRRYLKAVEQFWPGSELSGLSRPSGREANHPKGGQLESLIQGGTGAVSVVIPCGPELEYLHMGVGSLAVRIPSDEILNKLTITAGPLLTSSANQPGEPPANTIAEARRYFGNGVDFYTYGGDLTGRQSSTVIRMVDDAIEILRQGPAKISRNGENNITTLYGYQQAALRTAADKTKKNELFHLVLGLVGETGEIAEKMKKWVRDQRSDESEVDISDLKKELGDVLWYTAVLAHYFDIPLEEIASYNITKVADRQGRGVIAGSGDNR